MIITIKNKAEQDCMSAALVSHLNLLMTWKEEANRGGLTKKAHNMLDGRIAFINKWLEQLK